MKFWKIFPIFAQENGQNETLKFFELYELQWSRLLHFRSGREATRGLKKKRKRLLELEWATAHFLKLSHNTTSCIVARSRLSGHTAGSAVLWHTAG